VHPNRARERWFDLLCEQLLSLARASIDVMRGYVPVGARPDLGAATVVAWICHEASRAVTSADIADQLVSSGAVPGRGAAEVTAAVRQVRLGWIRKGLPITDWWDVNQLLDTLLTYLAPRIAAERGSMEAAQHLRGVFGLTTEAYIDHLVAHPLDPPALPRSPADKEPIGEPRRRDGADLLAHLASRSDTAAWIADIQSRSLLWGPGLARSADWEHGAGADADAWLREGQITVYLWAHLHNVTINLSGQGGAPELRTLLAEFEPDCLTDAISIATEALEQCGTWLAGLTEAERTLLRVEDEQRLRRRRWLDGYTRIKHAWLLVPDSIPDVTVPGARPNVPSWVGSYVFERGARFMHRAVGPLATWWGVVETDEEESDLALAQDRPGKAILGEEGETVVMNLPVGPGEWRDSALAPFLFWPEEPSSAVELLLVALAGVRLDWYRLRDDHKLEHLHATTIAFPAGSLAKLLDRVDATLARLEADEPNTSPKDILARSFLPPDQEQHMFVGVDNAKSESILFDLTLTDAGSDTDAQALVAARTALANAELARVSAEADGVADDGVRSRVAHARRTYLIQRQKVERPVGREFVAITTGVVALGRAFVQFAEEEYLSAVVAYNEDNGPKAEFVDLSHVTTNQIRQVADDWLTLASSTPWELAADALDALLGWVGRELIAPIVDVLHGVDAQHVVLCPSRALEPIPLHAAPVGTALLGDIFSVSYAPSASVMSHLSAMPTTTLELDLVVASSGAHAPAGLRLEVLQGPEQEAQALHALAPNARILSGPAADPNYVLAAIADSRAAHLAAHGWARPDMLASGLCLAGTTLARALLSAARVYAGPILPKTALVVLSACETARHPTEGRAVQTWRGLDSAFLSRGARAVVASLWKVDDLAALVYSTVLHIGLLRNATIAQAHATAAMALRGGAVDPLAGRVLDRVRPSWKTDLNAFELGRAYWWSAYRPSGICW
jgi:CHAT domain-containing protein